MEFLDFLKSYWGAIISSLALSVSTLTGFVIYRTFALQRTHNQKSLKPYLYVAPYDYENCLKVFIKNEGVGPAVVKKIKVQRNEYEAKTCIYKWLPSKLPGKMVYAEYFTRSGDFVLKQGGCEAMLEIRLDPQNLEEVEEREKIRGILRELTVIIEYEDVYENTMPIYTRSLNLFARVDNQN